MSSFGLFFSGLYSSLYWLLGPFWLLKDQGPGLKKLRVLFIFFGFSSFKSRKSSVKDDLSIC
jgi:hypothetical protein